MSEREKHIAFLEAILEDYESSEIRHSTIKDCKSVWLQKADIEAIKFAISSIKTDLKYDLMYENEPFITLDEMKEMREKIQHCDFRYSLAEERGGYGQVVWSEHLYKESDVLSVFDKKISELENKEC